MGFNFVPKNYLWDKKAEFGCGSLELENGMRVLVLNQDLRQDLDELAREDGSQLERYGKALKHNRWCVVSNIGSFYDQVAFLGTYDDGTIMQIVVPRHTAWIVKKDSYHDYVDTDKKNEVYDLVYRALAVGTPPDKTMELVDSIFDILKG